MLTLNGILLFKMFTLSSLYELYSQKHLSLQIQNATLNNCFQFDWLKVCSNIVNDINVALELYDFCIMIFDCFTNTRKNIFINKDPITINYSIQHDNAVGFSTKRFRDFLKTYHTHTHESKHIQALRSELLDLLYHIEITKQNLHDQNVIVHFSCNKKYRNIREHLSVQYEFVNTTDGEHRKTIYISGCSTLEYETR